MPRKYELENARQGSHSPENGELASSSHPDDEEEHQITGKLPKLERYKDDSGVEPTDDGDYVEMGVVNDDDILSKHTPRQPLPPIEKSHNGLVNHLSEGSPEKGKASMKVGVDNTGFEGEPDSSHGKVDPDADEHPGPDVDAPVSFKPQKPPLAFCKFIVNHHKLAFFLMLSGHIFFIVTSGILIAAGYDLIPLYFEGVPLDINTDPTYLRAWAWRNRDEDESLLLMNTSADAVGARTKNGDITQIFFKDSNVLTKEKLEAIRDLEDQFTSNAKWSEFCKQDIYNLDAGCMPPISLIRFFDGSYVSHLNDSTFSNISGTLYTVSQMAEYKHTLDALVGNEAVITETEATSKVTRILFFTGLPLEGWDLQTDAVTDQYKLITDFLVDEWRSQLYDLLDSKTAGMKVHFYTYQLMFHDIVNQVTLDLLLAGGSMVFIFLFMLFQTRSLFLTGFAMASVFTSFLGCNLIYRIIFDFKYFGIFHVLSIFIILGIGADNIFVFNDTWRATAHERHASMEERLSSCYRRASKSMLITSLTTCTAFLSNAFSPLLGVSTFGIFSALLVIVNFFSAIVFFPTCVIMFHKKWENWPWPCFRPCDNLKCYPCNKVDTSKTGHRPNAVVRFFKGPFHTAVTNKYLRWLWILICTGIVVTFIVFAAQVKISKEGIQLYKEGHNYFEASELSKKAFKETLDDKNIKVLISFGLKEQDLSDCHKTDFDCKGKTVWDKSFDLNPKPAQKGLMELCAKIRNLQGNDLLYLKKDPVTGETPVKCFISSMNTYLKSDGHDASVYSPTLNLSLPTSEYKLMDFFDQRTDLYNTSVITSGEFYRYFETMKSYWLQNGYRNSLTSDYGEFSVFLGEGMDTQDTARILTDSTQYYGTRLRYAGIEVETSLEPGTLDYVDGLKVHDAWEKFVDDENLQLAPSSQGVQFTMEAWHEFKRQEALAISALQGIIIGISLSFVVLTIATTNIVISALATLTIVLVTATVVGTIPMFGWKISVIESINLSLVVGLAVDYVVHLSESYHHSPHPDRVTKVKDMLEAMGVSVISGAFSTLGAAVFMFAAEIQFFLQFGIFMFCVIGFSILYSLFLFTPLLSVLGPQGDFGSLVPPAKWVWSKITGHKEENRCQACHGKGFLTPPLPTKGEENLQEVTAEADKVYEG